MASFTAQRLGNGLSRSFEFAPKTRSISLRFTSVAERTRHRSHTSNPLSATQSRQFSANTHTFAQAYPSSTNSTNRSAFSRPNNIVRPQAPAASPPPQAEPRHEASALQPEPLRDISTTGLSDTPAVLPKHQEQVDWTSSFHGLSSEAFPQEAQDTLLQPLSVDDIEVKPDGILYLPEIKYRRILNKAFGPGGWGLAPRGETIVTAKSVTREYALVAKGRLVSIARGEQDYFDADGIPTATEGCKSNALMRCCKDLGVASELWDPRFIRTYMDKHAKEVWVEHVVSKKKKKMTMRKDDQVRYPFKETKAGF